jgi:hypothetical protein
MLWVDAAALFITWGCAVSAGLGFALAVWSLRWPSVTGAVEVSLLEPDLRGGQVSENHWLAYAYEVAGTKYLGSNVKPWGDFNWDIGYPDDADGFYQGRTFWSRARDLSKWYRPGAVVKVYYCPVRPAWACLEPGGFFIPLLLGGMAAFCYFTLLP